MNLYGLIGYRLSHSFSQKYFLEKFYKEEIRNADYQLFPLRKMKDFPGLLKQHPDLKGLNVTIPYKEKIIPYLDKVDPVAREIGAVNTLRIREEITGYNTDVFGFELSLKPMLKNHHKKALILGTGGASKAVEFVLKRLNMPFLFVSRNPEGAGQISYSSINLDLIEEHTLIINTTPLGMYPDNHSFPELPYEFLNSRHLLYDLVYNPEDTIFLIKGRLQGTGIKNGMEMLYLQAEKSWEIFNS